jgi:hypothetical protein
MAEDKPVKKKVIDVSHPGDSAPSETSKPVIITNRPIMKDPMMVSEKTKGDDTNHAPDPEMESKPEIKIEEDVIAKKDLKPVEEVKVESVETKEDIKEPAPKEVTEEDKPESSADLKDPDADLKKASEEELMPWRNVAQNVLSCWVCSWLYSCPWLG